MLLAAACAASQLGGTFAAVPNSAGAGNIVYALRLRNRSRAVCAVPPLGGLTLLDAAGRPLPTHAARARPGQPRAVAVRLAPGTSAVATARFSPDVPGPGEPVARPCERTAHSLRVTLRRGAAVVARVTPPTPVCEHGAMQLSVLGAA
jgi:hypothetical protein